MHSDFYSSSLLSQVRANLISQLRDAANIGTGIGFMNRID